MTAITAPMTISMPTRSKALRNRRLPASVYWRRRATVLLLGVGAVMSAQTALEVLGGGPLTAAEVRPSTATSGAPVVEIEVQPVAKATYVVRSGDTLWTIAKRIQPTGDVRPLVDALAAARDGRPLQPGERIVVP